MGEWFPIPEPPYWRYDDQAPDPDPTVTSMLPVYAAPDAEPVITDGSAADDTATGPVPVTPSRTAGEQDHTDPWRYAGAEADPPADCGRPA